MPKVVNPSAGRPAPKPKPAAPPSPNPVTPWRPTTLDHPAPKAPRPEPDTGFKRASVYPQPVGPEPRAKASPVLVKHGVVNTADEFKRRVKATVSAYRNHYGYDPTPGLVWDVARSPLDEHQIPHLFRDLPDSGHLALAKQYQGDAAADRMGRNRFGVATFPTPFSVAVSQFVSEHPQTFAEARASHPTVQPDMLPVPQVKPGPYGYKKPGDARGVYDVMGADSWIRPLMAAWTAATHADPSVFDAKDAIEAAKYRNPFEPKNLSGTELERWRKQQELVTRKAISTVKGAQNYLLDLFGDNSGTLKATGIFNDQWLKALVRYSHTTTWIEESGRLQAQMLGLKNYDEVLNSYKNKKEFRDHYPLFTHIINALPLPIFQRGASLGAVIHGQMNYVKGDTHSLFTPDVITSLTRTGHLAFDIAGGSISSAEALTASASVFAHAAMTADLSDPKEVDKAMQRAKHVFMEHPSLLRAAVPEMPDYADEPTWLKAAEVGVEIAGAIVLRKPVLMGPKLRPAASLAEFQHDASINAAAARAYGELKHRGDIIAAVKWLDGGPGSERLVVHAAPLIEKGKMSLVEFRNHLAELARHGETSIVVPARVSRAAGPAKIQAQVDKFEKDWDKFVGGFIEDRPYKRETAYWNAYNAKAKRQGRPLLPNQSAEIKVAAERKALDALEKLAVKGTPEGEKAKALLKRRDEIDKLKVELNPLPGEKSKILPTGIPVPPEKDLRGSVITVSGSTMADHFSIYLKTPGRIGRTRKGAQADIARVFSHALDYAQEATRNSRFVPGGGHMADFMGVMRSQFGHAAPFGESRHLFEAKLPERIRQFVIRYNLGTGAEADRVAARFIQARAHGNVPAMMRIQDSLRKRYFDLHGHGSVFKQDPFFAEITTEMPSQFRFPGFNEDEELFARSTADGLKAVGGNVHHILLRASSLHRHIILSGAPLPGGEVLWWKHTVADTTRRGVGGGFRFLDKTAKRYEPELENLLLLDQELARMYGTFMSRTKYGEGRYLGTGRHISIPDFNTAEMAKAYGPGAVKLRKATGGYLRRMAQTDELEAVLAAHSDDLSPILDRYLGREVDGKVIGGTRVGRVAFENARRARELQRTKLLREAGVDRAQWERATSAMDAVGWLPPSLTREEFAASLLRRFHGVTEALGASGQDWNTLRRVILDAKGDDEKIGRWVREHRIEFDVRNALVEAPPGTADEMMVAWIGQLMRPNKWNRGHMADNVFRMQYGALRKAGWQQAPAARLAMDVAERQTVYHMFDFQNMLQIEKDLRYVSYFATKHRLYWKWVISTAVHQPGAAILLKQAQQTLDQQGNLDLRLKIWGQKLEAPIARLFWVNTSGGDLPQWSPLALAAGGFAKGGLQGAWDSAGATLGNVLTRNDQAMQLGLNVARMSLGKSPSTFEALTAGVAKVQRLRAERFVNEYRIAYEERTGHPPTEEEAVHWAAWKLVAMEFHRANLPLPVVLNDGTDNPLQTELRKYGHIVDPVAARTYLDAHPEIRHLIGRHEDPKEALQVSRYFRAFNQYSQEFHTARDQLWEQAREHGGKITAAILAQRDKADKLFSERVNDLLIRDAIESGHPPPIGSDGKRKVPDGRYVPFGIWGQKFESDPTMDPIMGDAVKMLKKMFPKVKQTDIAKATTTVDIQRARDTLNWLSTDVGQAAFKNQDGGVESYKQLRRILLNMIEPYQSTPKDTFGKEQRWYIDHVVKPYWKANSGWYNRIQSPETGDAEKDHLYAQWRAWKDAQDKPVTRNGVTWPSPVRMAWMRLTTQERKERLLQMAQADPAHLAAYELDFLGHKVAKDTQRGWDALAKIKDGFRQQYGRVVQTQTQWAAQVVEKGIGGEDYLPDSYGGRIAPHPGFQKEFAFASQPKAKRIRSYQYVRDSAFWDSDHGSSDPDFGGHPNWKNLTGLAADYHDTYTKAKVGPGKIKRYWRETVGEDEPGTVLHWVKSDPAFWREVKMAGGVNLLNTLVATGGS